MNKNNILSVFDIRPREYKTLGHLNRELIIKLVQNKKSIKPSRLSYSLYLIG
jgi:hypothetical protein